MTGTTRQRRSVMDVASPSVGGDDGCLDSADGCDEAVYVGARARGAQCRPNQSHDHAGGARHDYACAHAIAASVRAHARAIP